mgnify:CR=1 FL=1
MTEAVVCSSCMAEPGDPNADLIADGWDVASEFGPRCPECASRYATDNAESAGLEAVAAALNVDKKK